MNVLRRTRHSEQFLMLRAAQNKVRGFTLELSDDRGLKLGALIENISPKDLAKKKRMGLLRTPIILSVNPSEALTVTVPLVLEREEGREELILGATELENILAQKMLSTFREHRASIGRTIGVGELDVALVDAKAKRFAVDGRPVLTPVGFRSKNIEVLLELTFTTRGIFDEWKDLFSQPDSFFFTEAARAELYSLERTVKPPVRLLFFEPAHTSLFALEKHHLGSMLYRSPLDWKIDRIREEITNRYGVSEEIGNDIYHSYFNGQTSVVLAKAMRGIFQVSLASFDSRLHEKPLKGKVYVESAASLPLRPPLTIGGLALEEVPFDEILNNFHLHLHPASASLPFRRYDMFRELAPFFEFYYDRGDTSANRSLRRRLHWLIT